MPREAQQERSDESHATRTLESTSMGPVATELLPDSRPGIRLLGMSLPQLKHAAEGDPVGLRDKIHYLVHAFRTEHGAQEGPLFESAAYANTLQAFQRVELPREVANCVRFLSEPGVYQGLRRGWSPRTTLPELDNQVTNFLCQEIAAALAWTWIKTGR